jgi:hypothetical protein
MRPLADWKFDATRPLQTKRGTAQALRCGEDKVDALIDRGLLKVVTIGRSARVTTESIQQLAATGDQNVAKTAAKAEAAS